MVEPEVHVRAVIAGELWADGSALAKEFVADEAARHELDLAFVDIAESSFEHRLAAFGLFFLLRRGSGGEETFPVLFDAGVDVGIFVQAELTHDVDGEMLRGHFPFVHEVHQDLRPLLATGHDAQCVLAQRLVSGDLTFPTEHGKASGMRLSSNLAAACKMPRLRLGAALDLQNRYHRHHGVIFAEFGQSLCDGDSGRIRRFGVGKQFEGVFERLRVSAAQREWESEDRMQAFLWRHLVPAPDLKAVVFDPDNRPAPKRVMPPATPADIEEAKKKLVGTTTKFTKSQVTGRLRQIEGLYVEGLLTDAFTSKRVAECAAHEERTQSP